MTHQQITAPIAIITEQDLARCHRILDLNKHEVFYQVESERDSLVEYEVRALRIKGEYHLTCTCPAGRARRGCWHLRLALAWHDWRKRQQTQHAAPPARMAALQEAAA